MPCRNNRERNMKELIVGLVRTDDPLGLCVGVYERFCAAMEKAPGITFVKSSVDINGAQDAESAAAAFDRQGVDLTILMCCSLVGDGRVVQPFMRSRQEVLIWCVPEPVREGPLLLNSMTCANLYTSSAKQMERELNGKRVKWLYGLPEDPLMVQRLSASICALRAKKNLWGATVVQVGKTADGFINLGYYADEIERNLGVQVIFYSLEEIFRDMDAIPGEEASRLAETITKGACCCSATEQELLMSARLILAVRRLKERYQASAFAISCWPEFQDNMHISTCLAFSRLGEEGIPVSCEGDVPGALTMLLARELSGSNPMLMDMVAMDEKADAISFWHCGMGLPCYADEKGFSITQYPADPRIFKLPGASVDIKFAPRDVTILRLDGKGGQILACEAQIIDGPDRGYDGARGWYSGFTMDGKRLSCVEFLNMVLTCGAPHHYVICPGHVDAAAREFAVRQGLNFIQPNGYTDGLR